jgi:hypothetical protein
MMNPREVAFKLTHPEITRRLRGDKRFTAIEGVRQDKLTWNRHTTMM